MNELSWAFEREDISEQEKQDYRKEFIQKYGCEHKYDEVMYYIDQVIMSMKANNANVIITEEDYGTNSCELKTYITIKNGKNYLHIEGGCIKGVIEYEVELNTFVSMRTYLTFYINPRLFNGEFPYKEIYIANDTMQYDKDRGLLISFDGNKYHEVPIKRSCKNSFYRR